MNKMRYITFITVLMFSVGIIYGAMQSKDGFREHDYTYVDMRQGLPHNFIDCICRDSQGYVWMGLGGAGLVRYDGYGFLEFKPGLTEKSISGSFVTALSEDKLGRLWVASEAGIDMLDLNTMKVAVKGKIYEELHDSVCNVKHINIDANGRLWAISSDCVWCIAFDSDGDIERVARRNFYPYGTLNSSVIRDLDGNGSVFITCEGWLSVLRYENGEITEPVRLVHLADHLRVLDEIRHGGDMWIATDIGLYRWNGLAGHEPVVYRNNQSEPKSLSQNYVNALAENFEGKLFVGTLNGLNYFDDSSSSFIKVALHAPSERFTLSNSFVNCITCEDKNIWVGTEGGGAVLVTPKRIKATYQRFGLADDNSYYKPVNAICEDELHKLWVGVVEGGLYYKNKGEKDFKHIDTSNSPLPHNSVSTVASDHHGGIWVGTWGSGAVVLDQNNPTKKLMTPEFYSENDEYRPYIGALQYDSLNQGMWIGTSSGLFFYEIATGRVVHPIKKSDNVNGAIGCAIDENNHLWLGSFDGLYDIDLASRTGDNWAYRKLEYKLDEPASKLRDHITSVALTRNGDLWVGSSVHGAYMRCTDAEGNETFVNYDVSEGLPHNSVMGILEDNQGKIWFSTYNGLASYDAKKKSWEKVTGLRMPHSTQFYWNAYVCTSDGHLLFGTTDGMVDIDTKAMIIEPDDLAVHFTQAYVDGERVDLCPCYAGENAAWLEYTQSHRTLQVEFTALDFAHDPSCTYYYKLEGFDKDWVKLQHGRHDVTYTNLSPGHYQLHVAYGSDGANELRKGSLLTLDVLPLFYNTWWFRLLCLLAVCAMVLYLYQRKMRSMRDQRNELEQKVEERTSRINEQKQALEERNNEIQELTVDRLSFFTNITHEFRTPITLILGPLQQAIKQTQDPKLVKQLKLMQRNANYLLSLVNQLMDFRKMESGKLEIRRRPGNFAQFLTDTIAEFVPLAEDRRISLDTICTVPSQNINFDKEAMRKLLHNFVTNSLKYTPEGGGIVVRAALLPEWCHASLGSECKKLYVSVSDTGDGLNPDDIDKIFDRFYQGTGNIKYPSAMSSSGIGLYLCKSIVEGYGGILLAKNNRGPGATFRVLLPITTEIQAESSVTIPAPLMVEESVAESQHELTVLVVEDNSDMRQYISDFLSPHYRVITAANGQMALNTIARERVDLIISDLMMPVMDGMELAREVKSNLSMSHIPIIMLTAKSNDATRKEGYAVGVDDFVTKPFNPDIMLERIGNIVKNKMRYQRAFTIDYEVAQTGTKEETRDQKFLRNVMEVVKKNYKNSYFEVGDFAEELGVSRSFLNKKLQALIGQSASQLVKNYRLKLAREKILSNRDTRSYTISEIAYDVGFNDSKYFTKCFVKEFGITPSGLLNNEQEDGK